MTKRYHLFAGENYYPDGGAEDHRHTGSLESCRQRRDELEGKRLEGENGYAGKPNWWHIADANLNVVEDGDYPDERPTNAFLTMSATHAAMPSAMYYDPRPHPLIEAQIELGIINPEGKATP